MTNSLYIRACECDKRVTHCYNKKDNPKGHQNPQTHLKTEQNHSLTMAG